MGRITTNRDQADQSIAAAQSDPGSPAADEVSDEPAEPSDIPVTSHAQRDKQG